jgi:lysozyme
MTLEQQLIRHEGCKYKPYICPAGKLTIGVGRNLQDVGISEAEAMFMLTNDIKRVYQEIMGFLPWTSQLDPIRLSVLANMCFNLGIGGLLKFMNTLELVKSGEYKQAANAMLKSKWASQVGVRAIELSKQMEIGEWQE